MAVITCPNCAASYDASDNAKCPWCKGQPKGEVEATNGGQTRIAPDKAQLPWTAGSSEADVAKYLRLILAEQEKTARNTNALRWFAIGIAILILANMIAAITGQP